MKSERSGLVEVLVSVSTRIQRSYMVNYVLDSCILSVVSYVLLRLIKTRMNRIQEYRLFENRSTSLVLYRSGKTQAIRQLGTIPYLALQYMISYQLMAFNQMSGGIPCLYSVYCSQPLYQLSPLTTCQ